MKHLIIPLIVFFTFPGLSFAQNDNNSLISNDSILKVVPDGVETRGVVQGTCRTVFFEITNIGPDELGISALYLDDAAGTDDFELINPRPLHLWK